MILLDGVYAVVGIAVSWLLLRASALAAAGPTRRYPFGREGVTPFVIGMQGFVLLGTLVYAAAEGVYTIRAGGSDVAAGWAIVYAVIATAGSLAFWVWLRRAAGDSDLLLAESLARRVGALRGAGMLVGFVLVAILGRIVLGRRRAVRRPGDGVDHLCPLRRGAHPDDPHDARRAARTGTGGRCVRRRSPPWPMSAISSSSTRSTSA